MCHVVKQLRSDYDILDVVLIELSDEDAKDGPGFGCISPEQMRRTANQAAMTKTIKLCTKIMENSTFVVDDLPDMARFLIPCLGT